MRWALPLVAALLADRGILKVATAALHPVGEMSLMIRTRTGVTVVGSSVRRVQRRLRWLALGCFAMLLPWAAEANSPSILWSTLLTTTRGGGFFNASFAGQMKGDQRGAMFVLATDGVSSTGISPCAQLWKLSAADGSTLWKKSNCPSYAQDLVVDSQGDVVVLTNTQAGYAEVDKYSGANGSLLWTQALPVSASYGGTTAVLDASGNVFVTAGVKPTLTDLNVTSFDGASGRQRWTRTTSGFNATYGVKLLADGVGGIFAMTNSAGDAATGFRAMKLSADSGAVVWNVTHASASGFAAALNSSGDLLVAQPGTRVVRFAGPSGDVASQGTISDAVSLFPFITDRSGGLYALGVTAAPMRAAAWKVSNSGGGSLLGTWPSASGDAGYPLHGLIDSAGRLVTMTVHGSSDRAVETVALSSTGSIEWIAEQMPDGGGEGADALIEEGGGIVALMESKAPDGSIRLRLVKYALAGTAAPLLNVQGLWWRAPGSSQPGWGINVVQQGTTLFATWFTYDEAGKPIWFYMPAATPVPGIDNTYSGALLTNAGPAFDGTFNPTAVSSQQVGTATLGFSSDAAGIFGFTVGIQPGGQALTRFDFDTPTRCAALSGAGGANGAANYSDIWWKSPAGSESGWGLNIVHEGATLFATWFTYGHDGRPTWFFSSDMKQVAPGRYEGTLARAVGNSWRYYAKPEAFVATPAGTARLDFSDASNGTFTAVVDGVAQAKPITRYIFGNPPSSCR